MGFERYLGVVFSRGFFLEQSPGLAWVDGRRGTVVLASLVMWRLQQWAQSLLAYKDMIGLFLQACLLIATFALIRVGGRLARAANAQARAAKQQVRAADAQAFSAQAQAELAQQQIRVVAAQLEASRSQVEASRSSADASRLQIERAATTAERTANPAEPAVKPEVAVSQPNLQFRDADPGFATSPVRLRNAGPGVAYRVNYRFVSPAKPEWVNRVVEVGTVAEGQELSMPWGFDKEYPRLQTRLLDEHGFRVEYMDAAGRLYATTAKLNQQNEFVTDSGPVAPEGDSVQSAS